MRQNMYSIVFLLKFDTIYGVQNKEASEKTLNITKNIKKVLRFHW